MSGSDHATPVAAPTLVVGLGRFGSAVAQRLATEAASGLRDPEESRVETEAWAELVRAKGLDLVHSPRGEKPAALAERVAERARVVLAHERLSRSRDARGRDGPTRLHVLVLAHLGERDVRQRLSDVLAQTERILLDRFGPIFERFRSGNRRNLVVLPLLAMPHPGSIAEGDEVREAVTTLTRRVAATPPRDRAVPQVFVIEDVAEFSVLSEPELAQCVRNFATLLLYGLPAIEDREGLLYGRDAREPLATFACSVAELPRAKLRRYGINRVALELLQAIEGAPRIDDELERIDVLEEVELAALDADDRSEKDVFEVLERYAPTVERDPEPKWYARGETLRARYGPDHGDASRDQAQPPPEPPIGWALERMQEVERGWRLLQRKRFDDLIAKERRRIEEARDALLARIASMVDKALWHDPAPERFRHASELVEHVRRDVGERLERAVRIRDEISPPPAPSFDRFRDAHAEFLDDCRRKPDLGRMLLFGLLAVLGCASYGPELLHALADALGVAPGSWYEPLLREHAMWTCVGVAALLGLVSFGTRFRRAVRAVRERFHAMFDALEQTVVGARGSVLDYFASRLRLARQVARVEALLAVRSALDRDAERLTLLDRAVRRMSARLLDEQRQLGAHRAPDGREDLRPMLSGGGETLVEGLVGDAAARRLADALPSSAKRARIQDVLGSLARERGYAKRWREEVPFTDLDAIRGTCAPHAEPIAEWDPTSDPEGAEEAAETVATFVRRQARSLEVALNYSGHEARDATGMTRVMRGEAIVPPRLVAGVRRRLLEGQVRDHGIIQVHEGVEADRAYYLVATADIAEEAVPSLVAPPPARFEVEEQNPDASPEPDGGGDA